MTTPQTARCLALISACNARIEGMKAENARKLYGGNPPRYYEDDFYYEATALEQLAQEVIQC